MIKNPRKYLSKFNNLDSQEKIARIIVIVVILIVPLLLLWLPKYYYSDQYPAGAKVFTLTGIASQGRWTLEEVNSYNSWFLSYSKAEIRVNEGDLVILRLQSADVTHGFYAPTLGIGPMYIEPGHITTVTFRATAKGIHPYYCVAICGDCHYFMRGEIVVGEVVPDPSQEFGEACPHNLPKPEGNNPFERGKYLFQTMGCVACHGDGGRGGQFDPNYIKKTVPDLNKLASRMSIDDQEDADSILAQIERGKSVDELDAGPFDIPRKSIVLAKYRTVHDVIKQGRQAARADTTSFTPPLFMPAWGNKLADKDIDDILIYLFSVQVWEESE